SSRASHDEKVSQEGESGMDELRNRFGSLGHENQDASSDSDSKFEISDKPIVTTSAEVMPSAADDERTRNTAKIAETSDGRDAKRQEAADGGLSNEDKPGT